MTPPRKLNRTAGASKRTVFQNAIREHARATVAGLTDPELLKMRRLVIDPPDELIAHADEAARVFLAAYTPRH